MPRFIRVARRVADGERILQMKTEARSFSGNRNRLLAN
jgi:hypothetical protein